MKTDTCEKSWKKIQMTRKNMISRSQKMVERLQT